MSKSNPISVIVPTRKIDERFIKHVQNAFSHPNTDLIVYENNNQYSLTELYNKGLSEAKNDIIVFMHDDLIIETPDITTKINEIFKKNSDYGIIGLAGTTKLINGMWWADRSTMFGIVNHIQNGKKHTNFYSNERFNDYVKQVIIIDGLFMIVNRKKIKHNFNQDFKGYHFYDLPICLENHIDGVKIGVTTKIRVTHNSVGEVNKQWAENKLLFESKYKQFLPITLS